MRFTIHSFYSCFLCFLCWTAPNEVFSQDTLVQPPNAAPSQGRVERLNYFPSAFVTARNVDVWLPSDYDTNKKYGVIYMHDGQNLFDGNSTWNHQEWGIDESVAAYNSSAHSKNKNQSDSSKSSLSEFNEYIVVGIWNDGMNRHSNYFPQKVYESLTAKEKAAIMEAKRQNQSDVFHNPINSDDYLKFIVYELRPFINKTYNNTYKDPSHTVIGGSSMGGLISMYAICEYPGVFGTAACFSTHWPGIFEMKNNPIPDAMVRYFKKNLPDPHSHKILFTHGTEGLDALYAPTQKRINKIMTKSGYRSYIKNQPLFLGSNWKTQVDQGLGHEEATWQQQFRENIEFLLDAQSHVLPDLDE
jgi:predicted alpha/beta superfamily hydrolase